MTIVVSATEFTRRNFASYQQTVQREAVEVLQRSPHEVWERITEISSLGTRTAKGDNCSIIAVISNNRPNWAPWKRKAHPALVSRIIPSATRNAPDSPAIPCRSNQVGPQ